MSSRESQVSLTIVPITLKTARAYIAALHRHNPKVTGWKFGLGVADGEGEMRGVLVAGRPVARHMDDGLTLEVNRTATDGCPNANSALYGAAWRVGQAMGYRRLITYTQAAETGASMRAVEAARVRDLPPRKGWADSSVALRALRDPIGSGGVARALWRLGWPLPSEVESAIERAQTITELADVIRGVPDGAWATEHTQIAQRRADELLTAERAA